VPSGFAFFQDTDELLKTPFSPLKKLLSLFYHHTTMLAHVKDSLSLKNIIQHPTKDTFYNLIFLLT
jgi:hypothetical protein